MSTVSQPVSNYVYFKLTWSSLSDSLICNILYDSAYPVSWSTLLRVTLLQLCLTRACTTDVSITEDGQWSFGFCISPTWCLGGGSCFPGGQVAVLSGGRTPSVLWPLTFGAQANHLDGFLLQLRNMESTKAWPVLCCRGNGVFPKQAKHLVVCPS